MTLPFVLVVGNAISTGRFALLGSISGYYYTAMRDVFVGGLCAIGVFLISYRYRKLDDVLSSIAGVLAIALALLPITPQNPTSTEVLVGRAHMYAAVALFLVLAFFCFFIFTNDNPDNAVMTRRRWLRNCIYCVCGAIIVVAIALAVASQQLPLSTREMYRPLFWCETVAVLSFGIAWLVKGETIFRDSKRVLSTLAGASVPGDSGASALVAD